MQSKKRGGTKTKKAILPKKSKKACTKISKIFAADHIEKKLKNSEKHKIVQDFVLVTFSSLTSRDLRLLPTTLNSSSSSTILL